MRIICRSLLARSLVLILPRLLLNKQVEEIVPLHGYVIGAGAH